MPTVLLIDDAPVVHARVADWMRDERIEVHSTYDGNAALSAARALRPDLILLDVALPRPDGFEVCRRLKADPATADIPVIFLSAATSSEQKIMGLNLGAVDYVTKPCDPAELLARVRAALRTSHLMRLLAERAHLDGLTGLRNRAYLAERLAAELSLARRLGKPLGCVMADVDHFKQVNDAHGHPFGDDVLRAIADAFTRTCRAEDVVCRYGGEEFVLLLPAVGMDGAVTLAERLRSAVAGLSLRRGHVTVPVTCSFGVADSRLADDRPGVHLVGLADRALYEAKRAGRNRVCRADQPGGARKAG